MSEFSCLLLPLDASSASARAADCAFWLADVLGATLHVVHATGRPLPALDALDRLRVHAPTRARVVIHQPAGDPEAAVLEAIETHHVDLVVMSARGSSLQARGDVARPLGSVAGAVLERTSVPVVLLPTHHGAPLPWTSVLAAASGEPAADEALDRAARLAAALRLPVTVLHIEDGHTEAPALGAYADAPHHEVPGRFEHVVERGLTRCTTEEAHCVAELLLRRGDAASVLLDEARRRGSSLIAIGWQGTLGAGRAQVFKRLLREATAALLVVRTPARASPVRLKVGSEIDAG